MTSATQIAESASYQAFVNCYLNEFDNGRWLTARDWQDQHQMQGLCHGEWLVELNVHSQKATVAVDVSFYSLTSHHQLGQAWIKRQNATWSPLPQRHLLWMLAHEIYHRQEQQSGENQSAQEIELMARMVSSLQLMSAYIAERQNDPMLESDRFIDAEQSILYGHWSHPTPKSRQGMHEWQQSLYTPEMKGRFQLHWYAVNHMLIEHDSATKQSAVAMIDDILGKAKAAFKLADDERVVPLHPLQAAKMAHDPLVQQMLESGQIRDLGKAGPLFSATSSVRTLYLPRHQWMLKVSIPVKITNSQRLNQKHELKAGVLAARLLQSTGYCERYAGFHIITDPAYLTVNLPGREDSGFETAIRVNLFPEAEDTGIYCMAALLQDPLPARVSTLRKLIEGLALSEGRSIQAVSRDWFNLYWHNAVEPLIRLFDEHGIALEAHLQNSVLDVSCGYPRRYFYRDNQGFYLAQSYRQHLLDLAPTVSDAEELFYDEAMIHDRFGYYLVLNQLAGVIHRFGADGLISETTLLAIARQRLSKLQQALNGAGARLIHRLLNQPKLPCKSNLLTRVHDVDELTAELEQAVYTTVQNPFLATYPDSKEDHDADRRRFATL